MKATKVQDEQEIVNKQNVSNKIHVKKMQPQKINVKMNVFDDGLKQPT